MCYQFNRLVLLAFIAVSLFCVSLTASAEQKKAFGPYDVHYSVLTTTFISPDTAKRYGNTRGKNRALLNIAVRKRLENGSTRAQHAIVKGSSSDLIHSVDLPFTEITEQDAIYYLAEFRFFHKEMRTFTIKIQPDPNIAAYTLKFSKSLYNDK